jgi:hypothetical protein
MVLNSVAQSPGTPMNSGPVSGVQAMAKAQAAIRPHMPAEAATERPARLAAPPGPASAAAHARATAMAIPVQNQIISGGSVPLNHRLGWG